MGYSPEKVCPNTSSSGFSIAFGVCVRVMANLLASISGSFVGAWTLYALSPKAMRGARRSEERSIDSQQGVSGEDDEERRREER